MTFGETRARTIVKLAAQSTEIEYLRDWFLRDERGFWEREAARLMHDREGDEADTAIAVELVLQGLEALLRSEGNP